MNEDKTTFMVSPDVLVVIEERSTDLFDKKLEELDYEQASSLLGGLIMAITRSENTTVSDEGRVIVDSKMDGKDAVENYGVRMAEDLAPRIDDEQTLIINIVRNKTLWDTIRKREPKVLKTMRFKTEPVQYS